MTSPARDQESPPTTFRGERVATAAGTSLAGCLAVGYLVGCLPEPAFIGSSEPARMEPFGALALALLSAAFGVLHRDKVQDTVRRLGWGLWGVATLIPLLELLSGVFAANYPVILERWLSNGVPEAGGLAVAPASWIAAGLIIVSGLIGAVQALPPPWQSHAQPAGRTAAMSVVVFGGFVAFGHLAGIALLDSPKLQLAFWPALILALLNAGQAANGGIWPALRSALLGPLREDSGRTSRPGQPHRHRLMLVVLGLGLVLAGAFLFLRTHVRREHRRIAARLTNVVELSTEHLGAWRRAHLCNGRVLMRAQFLGDYLAEISTLSLAAASRAALETSLKTIRQSYGYASVTLLDRNLAPVLTASGGPVSTAQPSAALRRMITTAVDVVTEDFHYGTDGEVWSDFLIPLRRANDEALAGAILLRIDARRDVFRLLTRWPADSDSAEIILLHQEDHRLVLLSDLHLRPHAMQNPSPNTHGPRLLAALATREPTGTLLASRDSRHASVLGLAGRIPETPWLVLAKIDRAEAYSPLRTGAWQITSGCGVLLAGASLLKGRYWRRHILDLEARQGRAETAERAAAVQLGLLKRHVSDAVLIFNQELGIVEANDRANAIYGHGPGDWPRLTARDLQEVGAKEQIAAGLAAPLENGGAHWKTVHRRKDGAKFPVAVSAQPVTIDGRPHVLAIIRDLSLEAVATSIARTATQEVAQIRQRMQFLVSATPAVIFSIRAGGDYRTTFVSQNVEALLGYRPEDFCGDPTLWERCVHPEDLPRAHEAMTRLSPSRPMIREYRFRHRDGTYRWMHDEVRLVVGNEEREAEIFGFWADITARREAEQTLREREELFATIVGQAVDAMVVVDMTGRFIEFNAAAHECLGYSRQEFANFNLAQLQADPSPEQMRASLEAIRRQGSRTFESRHRHRNGDFRDVNVRARIVRIRNADFLVANWNDVTEQRRMDLTLRASEERHRTLFENMDLGVVYQDVGGVITWANPAATRILGLSLDQLQGRTSMDPSWHAIREDGSAFPGEDHPAMVALRTNSRINGVVMGIRSNAVAEVRWILIDAVPETQPGEDRPFRVFTVFADISIRRRAEIQIRRLSRIIEQAPLTIVITDLAGRIEYANPYCCQSTGYAPLDLIGKNPRIFKSGETKPETYRVMWNTLARREVWRGELRNRTKNGEPMVMEAVIAPVMDDRGKASGYVSLQVDVTEQRKAADELRHRVNGLRTLHSVAKALEQRDLSRQALVDLVSETLPAAVAFPEDTRVTIEIEECRQARGPEGPVLEQTSVPIIINGRAAGSVAVGLVRPRTMASDNPGLIREREILDNLARTIGMGLGERELFAATQRFNVDLEETVSRRTAELENRNREIQALMQSIPDMVVQMSAEGTVLNCQLAKGDSHLRFLAPAKTERPDCHVSALLLGPVAEVGRKAIAAGATVATEEVLPLPAGALVVELRASPIGTEAFVVFIRDITDRKKLETETRSMLEKERQISEMKSRFISVTSHEFRTPIAAAMGTLELLTNHFDRIVPAKREEMFSRITGALQRMTQMLDELLLLNRTESGRLKLQLTPVNLPELVESIVSEARLADRGAHQFVCRCTGETKDVATDAHVFRHILDNLLSNAARYSPAGSLVTIEVQFNPTLVRLAVEDQGIGVPEADRTRIFETFERGSNVGPIKGTGLGLSIVQRMTHSLGGTVRIETPAAGPGSRFVIELPRQAAPPTPKP